VSGLLATILRGEAAAWPGADNAGNVDDADNADNADNVDNRAGHRFIECAQDHKVLPLVAWQDRRRRVLADWPDTLRQTIAKRARQTAIAEQINREEILAVLRNLRARGIRAVLLKGAALAYTHYPHPCLRPRDDFDLLVADDQVSAADQVLQDRGYEPLRMLHGRFVSFQRTFVRRAGGATYTCDLHWRASNRLAFAQHLSMEQLGNHTQPVAALGVDAECLASPHALFLACVHRVAHHLGEPKLIWIYDIHLLVSSMSDHDAEAFVALAHDRRVTAICHQSVALANQLFATRLPGPLKDLEADSSEPLAGYVRADFGPAGMLLADLRSATSYRARLLLLREHLFPPVAFLRASRGWLGSGPVPFLYARRLIRGAARWLTATGR
jgi:hypothetical protein